MQCDDIRSRTPATAVPARAISRTTLPFGVVTYVEGALDGVASTPIDKIACDVTLPGADGFDASRIGPNHVRVGPTTRSNAQHLLFNESLGKTC